MKEVYLYKKLKEKKVQCQNCAHYCLISPGKRGICQVRENQDGKLYALNYGKAVAINIDPIEKKPFFHFLPGSHSLSIATVGCNFKCLSCQNWDISQMPQLTGRIGGQDILPEEIIKITLENKLPSISYTYTEPAIFSEYALDTMKLAKKEGLKNNWVTNGFWSKELFDLVSPYLDAANVDLKGFGDEAKASSSRFADARVSDEFYIKYCGGRLQPVLDTLKRLKRKKIWVEVTTLVINYLSNSDFK
jgi:pyruvate formate lyase activating enzyme